MGVWLLIGLSAYLRPHENFGLRRQDLLRPSSSLHSWSLLLAPSESGRVTKTGHTDDSVPLDSKWASWMSPLLETLKAGPPQDPLWDFSYPSLVHEFRVVADLLQLHDLVPYQLRHSGASLDRATAARPLDEVRKRGRWLAAKSVARYEKSARLSATEESYPQWLRDFGSACAARLEAVFLFDAAVPALPPPSARAVPCTTSSRERRG